MFKDAPLITMFETELVPNGIGGFKEVEKEIGTLNGWIDLLTTDTKGNPLQYNADLQESTHVCIVDYTDKLKKGMKLKDANSIYLITLVDNPVSLNHHVEIYLKYEGAANV